MFDRYDTAFGAEGPYLGTDIIGSDGAADHSLVAPVEVVGLEPVWSPDGRQFALSVFMPPVGPGLPAIINVDGTGFTLVQPEGIEDGMSCSDWSPDGQTLLCSHSPVDPDPNGIYTVRPDGTGLTRLTRSPFRHTVGTEGECGGGDGRGVFSPDGERIAFIRQKCGTGANPSSDESAAIEVMDSDGGSVREIVEQGGVMSHPGSRISWSPNGTSIVFGSQEGELFVVRPDGTGLAQIHLPDDVGDHHAFGPDWSPDGTRIVFSMYVAVRNSTDLYTISPDGSNLARLTTSDGAEAFASWGLPVEP